MYIYMHIYNNHCCFLEANQDLTCRDNCTRFATTEGSLWIGEATRFHDADDHCHFR